MFVNGVAFADVADNFTALDNDADAFGKADEEGVVTRHPAIHVFFAIAGSDGIFAEQFDASFVFAAHFANSVDIFAQNYGAAATTIDSAAVLAVVFEYEFEASAIKFVHKSVDIAAADIDGLVVAKVFELSEVVKHEEIDVAATMKFNDVLHPFHGVKNAFIFAEARGDVEDFAV